MNPPNTGPFVTTLRTVARDPNRNAWLRLGVRVRAGASYENAAADGPASSEPRKDTILNATRRRLTGMVRVMRGRNRPMRGYRMPANDLQGPPACNASTMFPAETLDAHGAAIYHEAHGDPKDPVLLLLHGGLGNIEDFNGILPLLRGRFRIVGIDSRGHGRSTLGSQPLTYESLQHDAEHVIAQLAPDRLSILGFSDGGIVAYRLAATQALRIERVATIGAHWELPPGDPTRELLSGVTAERWRSLFPNSYKRYQQLNPGARLRHARAYSQDDVAGRRRDRLSGRCRGSHHLQAAGRSVARTTTCCPRRAWAALAERVNGARVSNIPFAGHAAHEDQPEAVMRAVNAWPGQVAVDGAGCSMRRKTVRRSQGRRDLASLHRKTVEPGTLTRRHAAFNDDRALPSGMAPARQI